MKSDGTNIVEVKYLFVDPFLALIPVAHFIQWHATPKNIICVSVLARMPTDGRANSERNCNVCIMQTSYNVTLM